LAVRPIIRPVKLKGLNFLTAMIASGTTNGKSGECRNHGNQAMEAETPVLRPGAPGEVSSLEEVCYRFCGQGNWDPGLATSTIFAIHRCPSIKH
jgi:hypothetical protein